MIFENMRSTITALVCTTGPGLGLGCIDDDSGNADESSEDGDGDTGHGDGDDDHLGEPLDHAAYCPDVEAPLLQPFIPARFGQLGPCGDLLLSIDPFGSDDHALFPVDGEPERLPRIWHRLSPRGRVLLSYNFSDAILTVRELGQAEEQTFMLLTQYASPSGFVISEFAPGARVWICDDNTLDLIVDGERTTLATNVDCATVATSKMHSQLVFATLEHEVIWVDTDAGTITPTSLAGFEYAESDAIGSRKDMLELSESGSYVIHTIQEVFDNDGAPMPYPIDESLFDLVHDRMLINPSLGFYYLQAAVFGAPLFAVVGNELFGIRDGQMTSITADIKPYAWPSAARDGSVVLIESDGTVVRYSGEQFDTREVEVPAEPQHQNVVLSPDGQAGVIAGQTVLCATPACERKLDSLRQFSLAGPGPQLLSPSYWRTVHVFDDGSVLADGSLVDGPFAEEVPLPDPKLLLIGSDGQVRAEWVHIPELSPTNAVLLADGRVVVGLAGWEVASELLTVDPVALTITKIAEFEPFVSGIQWLGVDGLGERIAVVLSATAGLAWGEVP
jgi:hypothetical protein